MIRFWDTSALVKVYSSAEIGHRESLRLPHGPRTRALRHATSMLVTVELVSAIVRRLGASDTAIQALHQLESFSPITAKDRGAKGTARHLPENQPRPLVLPSIHSIKRRAGQGRLPSYGECVAPLLALLAA